MSTLELDIKKTTFSDFDLDPRLLRALEAQGFEKPTPVQEQAIPLALAGRDVIAIAQTGTGKTLAFGLPALSRLAARPPKMNAMLVLAPTRELAQQCDKVLDPIAKAVHMRAMVVHGGIGYGDQTSKLKKGREVIVATPGRLLDHLERRTIKLDALDILVLDEADRMLDMGFLPDILRILRFLPKERQTMMCSATWPDEIQRLAQKMLNDPEKILVGAIAKPVEKVRQALYCVHPQDKLPLLLDILDGERIESAVIFMRTKQRTQQVARALKRRGYKAAEIHGDRSQGQREQALDGFRSGRYRLLVATDVAARGLDVEGISHVINYDIPLNADDYIHRIGRTARAECEGDAITFVSPQEHEALASIERALARNLDRVEWEKAAPVMSTFDAAPQEKANSARRGLARRSSRRMLGRRR